MPPPASVSSPSTKGGSPTKIADRPAWDARPARRVKDEASELAELGTLFGPESIAVKRSQLKTKSKAKTDRPASSASSSTTSIHRPAWNHSPLRNPPGALNGLKPITKEPWREVARQDLDARMEFGSRDALGLPDYEDASNGLVVEAKHKRVENAKARAWNYSSVRHEPPVLRGQKTIRRAEPWSQYHNDDIDELNAIEGTSINAIYDVTADRDNRVGHTITQPSWDNSIKLGRRNKHVDAETQLRARTFREQRARGTRAGAPTSPTKGAAKRTPGSSGKEPMELS